MPGEVEVKVICSGDIVLTACSLLSKASVVKAFGIPAEQLQSCSSSCIYADSLPSACLHDMASSFTLQVSSPGGLCGILIRQDSVRIDFL